MFKFQKPTKEDKKTALILILIIVGAALIVGIILIVDEINMKRSVKEYMDKELFNNGGTKLSDIVDDFKSEHPLPNSSAPSAENEKTRIYKKIINSLNYYKTKLEEETQLTSSVITETEIYVKMAAEELIKLYTDNSHYGAPGLSDFYEEHSRIVSDTQNELLTYLGKLEHGEKVTANEAEKCLNNIEFLIELLEIEIE